MRLAQKMKRLGTETAFEVLARAKELEREGKEIIHLEIGEPDFDTPKNIVEAGIKALREGYTHYSPSAGMPEVREVVAKYISDTRNIKVNADEVVITPGAKPIMFFCIISMVDEGDEVIYPNPGFPIYESMIDFIGGKSVPIQLREENQFRMDTEELKKLVTPRTKMIIINSPQNPTGGVLTLEDLQAIAEIAVKNDIYVLSDEIYSRILYEGEHHSIASLPDMKERTIILDGLSKTYAMTGWRAGYGVMNKNLAPHKISCLLPKGSFYVFPNVKKIGWQSKKLSEALLNEGGVAVLTGTSFGKFGEGYLRISYANSIENINKGLDRIKKFVEKI